MKLFIFLKIYFLVVICCLGFITNASDSVDKNIVGLSKVELSAHTLANEQAPIYKFENYKVELNDAEVTESAPNNDLIQIKSGTSKAWPGIIIKPSSGKYWNLASYTDIVLTIQNLEKFPIKIFLRADSPVFTNSKLRPWVTGKKTIPGNTTADIHVVLQRQTSNFSNLVGMQKLPSGFSETGFDPSKTSKLVLFLQRSSISKTFKIRNLRAVGNYKKMPWESLSKKEFLPFVDAFGQFIHADWPNKIYTKNDLHKQKEKEAKELKYFPRSTDWNEYGGWKKGPRFKATKHFRVKKINGKWWFIDPEGYLFWSYGIDVIKNSQKTIISERESYFKELDNKNLYFDSNFSNIKSRVVVKGYFKGRNDLRTYDFFQSNLMNKYGNDWEKESRALIHERLGSWGINTIGLWSAREITSMRKTPYVEWLYYSPPRIKSKGKYKTNMLDMWDPKFIKQLEKSVGRLNKIKNDPWCIGVFVDNELPWADAKFFVAAVLSAPAKQKAKVKLIEFLKSKYKNISLLNQTWGTRFESWVNIENSIIIQDESIPWDDANEFYRMSAKRYYQTINKFVKQNAPEILYLGSRLNGDFPIPAREAANYTDVISYNLYRDDVSDFAPPENVDKPVLIGEWHFGTDDNAVFGAGLVRASGRKDRAKKYIHYLQSAIQNSFIVGAHWFQYMDEPLTGRISDEENHQIGLVSITDTPYPEMINASRIVGSTIYTTRISSD